MTDLEITKACAEAMGWRKHAVSDDVLYNASLTNSMPKKEFDPLHDDAQAMALVKKFGLDIDSPPPCELIGENLYTAKYWRGWGMEEITESSKDLNRAICECVYKLHTAKRVA